MLLRILCGLVILIHACVGADISGTEWETFKSLHGRSYDITEDKMRREIFEINVKHINQHNLEAGRGDHSYRLGINKFADWTEKERKAIRTPSYKTEVSKFCTGKPDYYYGKLPDMVDWRRFGFITPVKNQGQCGSPWAFSVTGAIESREAIYCPGHQLVSLSEQNLLDCSSKYGNYGCNGGLMDTTYGYIKDNGGIDTEKSYPYEARNDKCRFNPDEIGAKIRGCVDLPKGNETALQNIVYINGPVSAGIHSAVINFEFYKSGVFDDPLCTPDVLDHAVLVIGYGTLQGKKYWIVKNSWGKDWGEAGYILIARDHGNECGISSLLSYPEMLCDIP